MKLYNYRRQILLAATLLLYLSACNSPPSSERTLIHCVTQAPVSIAGYVEQFEIAHPAIQVQVSYQQQIPDDWPRYFDAALIFNTPPQRPELLLDLEPLIEAAPQFDSGDYYPGALDSSRVDGRLVGIPIGLEFNALVYDPRQLSAAGAAWPAPNWSWEDLWSIATTVGRYHANGGGAVFVQEIDRSTFLLNWLAEQTPFHEELDGRLAPLFTRPEVLSALSAACSAMDELPLAGDPFSSTEQPLAYLHTGKAALTGQSLGSFAYQRSQYPDLAVTAFPRPNIYGDMRPFWALYISRGTAHPRAAWQWVQFLSQQDLTGALDWGYNLPARKSAAQEAQTWEKLDPEIARVIHSVMDGQPGLELGQNQEPWWIIRVNLQGALLQACEPGADISATLAEAQQQTLEELAAWYDSLDDQFETFSIMPPSSATDETGASPNILQLWLLHGDEQACLALAQEFAASHPGWSVQLVALVQQDWLADSVLISVSNYAMFRLFNLKQELLPVTALNELDPSLSEDSFLPQALQAVSWRGQLLGLPTAIVPLVLHYDAAAFERLGLAPPTSDWTVADVLDAAENIVAANPALVGYAPRSGAEVRFVLEQQGIQLFTSGAYPQPQFTHPDVLRAVERLRALQDRPQVLSLDPAVLELPLDYAGQFDYANWRVVALEPHPNARWPMQVYMSGVLRQSTNTSMAWEWVAFLARRGWRGDGALPAVQARANDEVLHQTPGDERRNAYVTALERDTALPWTDALIVQDVASWWFYQALKEAKTSDLEAALERAQAQAEQFVACQALAATVYFQTLATCTQQVDPEHWLARLLAP